MAGSKKPSPSPSPPSTHRSSSRSPGVSLQPSSPRKNPSKSTTIFRRVRSVFRSFPIITPAACKFPVSLHSSQHDNNHIHGGTRMTGTLFGYRKTRINLAIQENSRCVPVLLLELSIPTGKLLQEMGLGLVRIALECEKRGGKTKLAEEPIWTMYCNGRKMGYGVKREPTDEDLYVMQMLHAISMGAGVLPAPGGDNNTNGNSNDETVIDNNVVTVPSGGTDGELTYMRAHFERVIGSKDSETYYMMNPDGNSGPELSIFFVRV